MNHTNVAATAAASEATHTSHQPAFSPKTAFQVEAAKIIDHYNDVTGPQSRSERKLTAEETEWATRLEKSLERLLFQRIMAQADAGYSLERSQEEGAAELPQNNILMTTRVATTVKHDLGLR